MTSIRATKRTGYGDGAADKENVQRNATGELISCPKNYLTLS
jgi:hypothetical protein